MANEFKIGDIVDLNGKEYTITGTHARSYLLERDGKTYKATANKISSIKDRQDKPLAIGQTVEINGIKLTVGETIDLQGKIFTITGSHAKSFLMERNGKSYRISAEQLSKMNNNEQQKSFLQFRIEFAKVFDPTASYPTNESECQKWFEILRCDLSPENLTCDGELSSSQVRKRHSEIMACWRELEKIVGHKVNI